MAAKKLAFEGDARESLLIGVEKLARAVKSTLGPRGRNADPRQGLGRPDGHQGRRDRRRGNRTEGQDREHGSQAGQGSRQQDFRRRRRRHDHRDRPDRGDLQGRLPQPRGRRRRDGAGPRHPQGRRGRSRPSWRRCPRRSSRDADIRNIAAISANNDREVGKMLAEAMSKVGQDGVITVEEGKGMETAVDVVEGMQFDRGLPLAALRDRPRRDGLRAGKAARAGPRGEDLQRRQARAAAGEGLQGQAAAADHRRGRRGRGPGDAGGQQAARHPAASARSRRRATATAARPCSQDIGILTGAKVFIKDLGIDLENVALADLGTAKKITVDNDNTTIIEGAGEHGRHPGPHRADPQRDRDHHQRLRPREAPGAAGEAGRRRRPDQRRGRHRERDEGKEGPHRGRPARDAGGHRGRHPARRRRGAGPRPQGARRPQGQGRRGDRRRRSSPRPSPSRCGRSSPTPATARPWCSARSAEGKGGVRLQRRHACSTKTWSRPA